MQTRPRLYQEIDRMSHNERLLFSKAQIRRTILEYHDLVKRTLRFEHLNKVKWLTRDAVIEVWDHYRSRFDISNEFVVQPFIRHVSSLKEIRSIRESMKCATYGTSIETSTSPQSGFHLPSCSANFTHSSRLSASSRSSGCGTGGKLISTSASATANGDLVPFDNIIQWHVNVDVHSWMQMDSPLCKLDENC